MFTAVPVPRRWHSLPTSAHAVLWLPLLGVGLGALAGLPAAAVLWRAPHATLLAAVVATVVLAVLTRGLHLDGLADTADGLGSRAPAERALEIMRRSDIGPFGVVTLVLVLTVDVAALAALAAGGRWVPLAALAVAATTGRLAVVHACLPGMPPARPGGFGSLVAGSAAPGVAAALTLLTLAGGAGAAALVDASVVGWPVAQAVALLAGAALRAHTTRRFGGTTGDVFGALVEVTTATALLSLVLAH